MKVVFAPFFALLALCNAQADPESRTLRGGGGRGPPSSDRLQNMVDTCSTFACNGDDASNLDCTFEKSERPTTTDLTDEGIVDLKSEFKAKREERREQMLKCACCADMSVEDILAAKGGQQQGDRSRPFGGGEGSAVKPEGSGFGGGRPGTAGFGEGSRPQQGGTSGGDDMDIEEVLAEKCPSFQDEDGCGDMPADLDCTRFDSVTSVNTRGRRRRNFLFCGCCRD